MSSLIDLFDARWKEMQRELSSLKTDMQRTGRQERAEVAASVPVYPTPAALPTPGQMGRLAVVSGTLYVDTGSTWQAQGSGGGSVGSSLPVGAMMPYPVTNAPSGWLLCAGQPVSRSAYPDLFAVLGTSFGAGDGSTTFNLPDLRGRTVAGLDNMGGIGANRVTHAQAGLIGGSVGEETHTLTVAEMPSHQHAQYRGTLSGSYLFQSGSNTFGSYAAGRATEAAGGGDAHNTMQPTAFMSWIIKAA